MRQSDTSTRGSTDHILPPALDDDEFTLPEAFAAADYETYGGFAFHMPFFALEGRFGTHALYDSASASTIIDEYLSWIKQTDGPTFAYLHLADLHEPVDPPFEYWERYEVDPTIDSIERWRYEAEPNPGPDGERFRAHRRRLYSAAAAYVDDQLRDLVGQLPTDTTLMVTADHGEALWEWTPFDAEHFDDSRPAYGVDHGGTPYESVARVPLMASGIEVKSADQGSLIDITPTLLSEIGLPGAVETTGIPLTESVPRDRIRLIESTRYGYERKAVYLDDWKFVVSQQDGQHIGFRLPDETITDVPEDTRQRLLDALPPWPDGSAAEQIVSGLAKDRLEALGYV